MVFGVKISELEVIKRFIFAIYLLPLRLHLRGGGAKEGVNCPPKTKHRFHSFKKWNNLDKVLWNLEFHAMRDLITIQHVFNHYFAVGGCRGGKILPNE